MSLLRMFQAMQSGTPSDVLTLSGAIISAFAFGSTATAEFRCDNDGNIYRRTNFGSSVQLSSSTDWIRPTGSAANYEGRYVNHGGDAFSFNSQSVNVWQTLTSDFILRVDDDTPTAGGDLATFDFQLGDDGTSTSDEEGAYIIDADREDF